MDVWRPRCIAIGLILWLVNPLDLMAAKRPAEPTRRPAEASRKPAAETPKGESLSVKTFGAVGDGKTDDTAAFQAALDQAGKQPGTTVMVPIGNYLLRKSITIPAFTTLLGVWHVPTASTQMKGSTLLAVDGKGSEEGPPFIAMGSNSVFKGLTVFYPEQDDPNNIRPYPWCIRVAGDNASILDCLLVNPYKGIDVGTQPAARHLIARVYGQPLRIGIFVDQCYDVGRIENIHFWPFWHWAENSPIHKWMLANSECFVFARTDWEYVYNTFCFGYGVGYKFVGSKHGACNGNFLGIGADATRRAVVVEHTQPIGLLITNGEFVSFGTPDATEVEVNATNVGPVQFNNCAFWGPSDRIAITRGGLTSFNQCHFQYWDHFGRKNPAIRAEGGRLVINACRFSHDSPHVYIGEDVASATIVANLFAGAIQIENHIGEQAQIGLNVGDFRKTETGRTPTSRPVSQPATQPAPEAPKP